MIRDLRNILDGWEYEPGRVSARRIIGRDGQAKVQLRIDLGVLQMALAGRPDEKRPGGCESHLELLEQRLARHRAVRGDDEDFVVGPDDCRELRHEAYLYYQRYLSLFVLEDYEGVLRDTDRSLRGIEFCERYGACTEDRAALLEQRPYVLMMNTKAGVHHALRREDANAALAAVTAGLEALRELEGADNGSGRCARERETLEKLRHEVLARMPPDAPPRLEWELRCALAREDFERAARIRDIMLGRRSG